MESLFMPLVPGVRIVTLPTTRRRLLEALADTVSETGQIQLLIDELSYSVLWRGLWYLQQNESTWPNPLTIQATIEDDKGNISELVRFQIRQSHAEKVRLAVKENRGLMKLAPVAWFVNFIVNAWLADWHEELEAQTPGETGTFGPTSEVNRPEGEEQPIPEGKTPEGDELLTDAIPIPNQNGATWDDTFDWYYRAGRGVCSSLKNLAGLIGWAKGTVYNNHTRYKAQYGEKPMNKRE